MITTTLQDWCNKCSSTHPPEMSCQEVREAYEEMEHWKASTHVANCRKCLVKVAKTEQD